MKKIFSRILAVGLLSAGIIGVSSCDYLDQKPENLKTTDMIWETRVEAEAYLYNIYGYIWLSTDDPVVFGFADETSCVFSNTNVRNMVEGNGGPSSTINGVLLIEVFRKRLYSSKTSTVFRKVC